MAVLEVAKAIKGPGEVIMKKWNRAGKTIHDDDIVIITTVITVIVYPIITVTLTVIIINSSIKVRRRLRIINEIEGLITSRRTMTTMLEAMITTVDTLSEEVLVEMALVVATTISRRIEGARRMVELGLMIIITEVARISRRSSHRVTTDLPDILRPTIVVLINLYFFHSSLSLKFYTLFPRRSIFITCRGRTLFDISCC